MKHTALTPRPILSLFDGFGFINVIRSTSTGDAEEGDSYRGRTKEVGAHDFLSSRHESKAETSMIQLNSNLAVAGRSDVENWRSKKEFSLELFK
jgi:hypothetical protein